MVSRANTARYLLTEFERRRWQNQEIAVEGADRVHVEHIYPQSPPATWKAENHDQIIDRLGNLTLLGRPLNQSLANAKFADKRDNEVRGYRTSELKITQALTQPPYDEIEYWTIDEINERQERLADEARRSGRSDRVASADRSTLAAPTDGRSLPCPLPSIRGPR